MYSEGAYWNSVKLESMVKRKGQEKLRWKLPILHRREYLSRRELLWDLEKSETFTDFKAKVTPGFWYGGLRLTVYSSSEAEELMFWLAGKRIDYLYKKSSCLKSHKFIFEQAQINEYILTKTKFQ